MSSASKATRKRALEAHINEQPHKKVCTPTQGARTVALQQSFGKTGHRKQEHTPHKGVVGKESSNAQFCERLLNGGNTHKPTSKKLKDLLRNLPVEHAHLVESFGSLQQVVLLGRKRKQQCTFLNCRKPVESITGRQFAMEQMLQLKTVFPESLELTQVTERREEFPGSAGKMTHKEAQTQTVIDMPLLKVSAAPGALQEYTKELAERLIAWNNEGSTSTEPSRGMDSEMDWKASEGLRPEARTIPEAYITHKPCPVETPGPRTPVSATPAPRPLSSAKKPPSGLRSSQAKAKRLSFGTPEGKPSRRPLPPVSEEQNESALADVKDTGKDAELARQLRRQSLDGTLPVSLSALRAVNDTADIQASLTSAEMVAARQHAANLALLPRTFDSIRAMFGHTGPSIIPRQQVFDRMLGTSVAACQRSELESQINFLMAQIPGFVSWADRAMQGTVLKIDRKQDMKQLRERILCLATS